MSRTFLSSSDLHGMIDVWQNFQWKMCSRIWNLKREPGSKSVRDNWVKTFVHNDIMFTMKRLLGQIALFEGGWLLMAHMVRQLWNISSKKLAMRSTFQPGKKDRAERDWTEKTAECKMRKITKAGLSQLSFPFVRSIRGGSTPQCLMNQAFVGRGGGFLFFLFWGTPYTWTYAMLTCTVYTLPLHFTVQLNLTNVCLWQRLAQDLALANSHIKRALADLRCWSTRAITGNFSPSSGSGACAFSFTLSQHWKSDNPECKAKSCTSDTTEPNFLCRLRNNGSSLHRLYSDTTEERAVVGLANHGSVLQYWFWRWRNKSTAYRSSRRYSFSSWPGPPQYWNSHDPESTSNIRWTI